MPARPVNLPAILRAAGVESQLELLLLNRLERAGLPVGEPQVAIVMGRRWAFDRVWRPQKLAVEVQGGIWISGAHSRGSGVSRDCLKISSAVALGWRVMPITKAMIEDGTAVALIAAALAVRLTGGPVPRAPK